MAGNVEYESRNDGLNGRNMLQRKNSIKLLNLYMNCVDLVHTQDGAKMQYH
jgi:hypothetical protein